MPELPEVETSVRGVSPYLIGQTVAQIVIRQPKLHWVLEMQGARIMGIERRAKYLIIRTDKGDIIVYLGMSGSPGILNQQSAQSVGKARSYVITIQENLVRGCGWKEQKSWILFSDWALSRFLMILMVGIFIGRVAIKP